MLRLTGQVGGHDCRVGGLVCRDHGFRRAGDDVDADAPEEHPLGLCHEAVAGPDHDIGRVSGEEAQGEGGDGLDPAQGQDLVGARHLHGIEDRRVDSVALLAGRRGDDHIFDARDLGGATAHDGRGRVGIAPAGHVAAGRRYRDQPLAHDQSFDQGGLEFLLGVPLPGGEIADPRMGIVDVVLDRLRQPPLRRAPCLVRDHDLAAPAVELPRIIPHRRLAAGLHPLQHLQDDGPRLAVARLRGLGRLLEVGHGHRSEPARRRIPPVAVIIPSAQIRRRETLERDPISLPLCGCYRTVLQLSL